MAASWPAQGIVDGNEPGHLVGDVPALLIVAIVLAALAPRGGVARDAPG